VVAHGYGGGRHGFGGLQGGYGGAARQTTCYSCGGFGHMSRDCTQGQECYNFDEGLCYFCKIRACQTEHRRLPWSGVALMQPNANSNAGYVRHSSCSWLPVIDVLHGKHMAAGAIVPPVFPLKD
jgi:hypothetical protein